MKYRGLIFSLSVFTAIGTSLYWILVFTKIFPLEEIVPGYIVWFNSFPLADFWIVITSVLLAVGIRINKTSLVIISGLLTASAMIFLALNALLFGINTGTIFMLTMDSFIELGIKIYCISVGVFFIKQFSKQLVYFTMKK